MGYDTNFSPLGSSIEETELAADVQTKLNTNGGSLFKLLPVEAHAVTAGTWAVTTAVSWANFDVDYRNTSLANLDEFRIYAELVAGTYTLKIRHMTNSSKGILKVYIDTNLVATIDHYSVGSVYDVISTTAAINIATSGFKTLRFVIDGKNASSSGYEILLQTIEIFRTA